MLPKYIPFWPERASTVAGHVDALYIFLIGVTIFFTVIVFAMVIGFSIRYRRARNPVATQIEGSNILEIFWSAVPLAIAMVIFAWAAVLFFHLERAPKQSMEIYVTGKQWMWKIQHPSGNREINALHIPANTNVRLTMISQDVIHDFFVPEFRVKHDVLPNRYTEVWFNATKTGTYHIFCAEYCGTKHSGMVGEVVVMEPAQYQAWLAGGAGGSLSQQGEKLFTQYGCITCHSGESGARGPNLAGVYGSTVHLSDGRTVAADDNYVRESILSPQAKIVAGYGPIMPTFAGQVSEENLISLIAYIKSKAEEKGTQAQGSSAPQVAVPQKSGATR
jgi:cytochrome c oxidase subunit 2